MCTDYMLSCYNFFSRKVVITTALITTKLVNYLNQLYSNCTLYKNKIDSLTGQEKTSSAVIHIGLFMQHVFMVK